MEGLLTPDGDTVTIDSDAVNREFAAAMAASPDDAPAPPKRVRETVNEEPKRRGRPPKAERARVANVKTEPAKPSPQLDAQRSEGIKGLVQIGAALALVMDAKTPDDNIAWRADAVTLASNADAIAGAVVETAKHNASFAATVDKVTAAGPYAALVGVVMSVGMQLAANHGVGFARAMGAKSPEEVLSALEAETNEAETNEAS